ncbi:MAG: ABC transporter ATP-binding protein [Bacteroidetes bacterium]|nr:ABC transporter ATP-binding protein [Bacteroidota bacterium]
MSAMLHTEDLTIGHGHQAVCAGIDLQVRTGELVALLGVNGIGKSTLLRTLAGLHAPLAGRVTVQGADLATRSARDRARLVSIVLTGRPDTGLLTVDALVALGRQPWTGPWGRLSAADRAVVDAVMERTGTTALRTRALRDLSDGECQQVMVARALVQATPVVLLDEPTAHLDLPNRVRIVRLLRTVVREDAKAVLFSTHDVQLALDLCDRIVLMRRLERPWSGTPDEAIASGALEQAFAGSGIRFDRASGTHRFLP